MITESKRMKRQMLFRYSNKIMMIPKNSTAKLAISTISGTLRWLRLGGRCGAVRPR